MYIVAQILGYTLSKFIGIRVISSLKKRHRIPLILSLIGIAELALWIFSFVPAPYNIPFIFLNGVPLGMVWGVLFSFLEGRRLTEFLGIGLSVNMIMTSGILKSLYVYIQGLTQFSEFFMPFFIGFLALPFFILFVWMLSQIPDPTQEDIRAKKIRPSLDSPQRKWLFNELSVGLIFVIFAYALLTAIRDFRDNFAVEIWREIAPEQDYLIYSKTEVAIAIIVMLFIALFVFIRNNEKAWHFLNFLIMTALVALSFSTLLYVNKQLNPVQWMFVMGICFYLPYLIIQIALFERLIAYLKIRANVGYFVYLCDSVGYLGSVGLLIYKEFFMAKINFSVVLINFAFVTAILALVFVMLQYSFFNKKQKSAFLESTLIKSYP